MSDRTPKQISRFENAEALARDAADWLCERLHATTGGCAVCLSGGSTPRRLYELLAEPTLAAKMPWSRIHWFFGDERYVPADHPASNFGMAREALLSRVPIPPANIHPVPTGLPSSQEAAVAYERTLKSFYGAASLDPRRPLFAVTLLGLGEDGHTASLLPNRPALDGDGRWAVAVEGEPARISLTLPALNSSAETAFLVSGQAKRGILARVLAGEQSLPAARIRPAGELHWFVERSALPDDAAGAVR
jgi:6-phosphogluconolactonase